MASSYVDTLPQPEKLRYLEKLTLFSNGNGTEDPYKVPDGFWIDDVCQWPPVEFGDIYLYLINSPGQFTREKIKAYKSLDAYNYYIR